MNTRISLVIFFVVSLVTAVASNLYAADTTKYIEVSTAEAKALIDKTPALVIIDVSPAYAKGHLPKAINHPVGDGSLDKAIPTLDKAKPYLIYCHGDAPSKLGAQKMADAGFAPVYRLVGNYAGWVDAGFPVEK